MSVRVEGFVVLVFVISGAKVRIFGGIACTLCVKSIFSEPKIRGYKGKSFFVYRFEVDPILESPLSYIVSMSKLYRKLYEAGSFLFGAAKIVFFLK